MGHDHQHHHNHHRTGNIAIAFVLNLVFTIFEIVGGLFTNSIAILSDALHDLGDTLSLGLAWYFQNFSTKGRDKTFSYGYRRFSLLGAMINALVLLSGSILVLVHAVPRLFQPEETNVKGMIFMAILGIVFNGAAVFRLKKGTSLNEKVVSLHLLEDVLGWIAVLIGAIVMYFVQLPIIDPILSVAITCFILFNVFKNLKATFQIILQGIPVNADVKKIKSYLTNHPAVSSIHDFHIWSMDGEYNILTVHVVLKDSYFGEALKLKTELKKSLYAMGAHHTTIELEHPEDVCELINC